MKHQLKLSNGEILQVDEGKNCITLSTVPNVLGRVYSLCRLGTSGVTVASNSLTAVHILTSGLPQEPLPPPAPWESAEPIMSSDATQECSKVLNGLLDDLEKHGPLTQPGLNRWQRFKRWFGHNSGVMSENTESTAPASDAESTAVASVAPELFDDRQWINVDQRVPPISNRILVHSNHERYKGVLVLEWKYGEWVDVLTKYEIDFTQWLPVPVVVSSR